MQKKRLFDEPEIDVIRFNPKDAFITTSCNEENGNTECDGVNYETSCSEDSCTTDDW